MGNRETIEAVAELIHERSQDVQRVWAPENWREIDLEYSGQLVVRLRSAGGSSVDVEVFSYGSLLASEQLRKYRSAERLAELIENVHLRAIERG